MTRFHLTLLSALVLGACKPDPTVVPDAVDPPDPPPPVEIDNSVPQEPDPPELDQAAQHYLMGEYAECIALLDPIFADLKEREQYRASALAGSWLALAHAKSVYENSKSPAEWAVSMAQSTEDPQVDAAAALAIAAYQIGDAEYEAAIASLAAAVDASDAATATLAHVLHAEALIGAAFGGGESESIKNPEKLDEARAAYTAAASKAKGHAAEDLLTGRIEEGLAALADYKKDKAAACPHVAESIAAFVRANARKLLEGPVELARRNKCAVPPEAASTG